MEEADDEMNHESKCEKKTKIFSGVVFEWAEAQPPGPAGRRMVPGMSYYAEMDYMCKGEECTNPWHGELRFDPDKSQANWYVVEPGKDPVLYGGLWKSIGLGAGVGARLENRIEADIFDSETQSCESGEGAIQRVAVRFTLIREHTISISIGIGKLSADLAELHSKEIVVNYNEEFLTIDCCQEVENRKDTATPSGSKEDTAAPGGEKER